MKVRVIEEDFPENPYMNLALDEAIMREVEKGTSPPTLRFYRNMNAVIIGCFQYAEQEVDMDVVRQKGIIVAKRFTGGGAVYHDMGDINYSVIMRDTIGIGFNVEKLFATFMGVAQASLFAAGVPKVVAGMNDITSNGKKVMGAAATLKKGTLLFHSALLVDTNLNTLASVLKVPGIKLKDKGISTILERVGNIKEISGLGIEEVKSAILRGHSDVLGFEYEYGKITSEERAVLKRLYEEKYSKDIWNMGRELIEVK